MWAIWAASSEFTLRISTFPVFKQSMSLQASKKRRVFLFLFSAICVNVDPVIPAGSDPFLHLHRMSVLLYKKNKLYIPQRATPSSLGDWSKSLERASRVSLSCSVTLPGGSYFALRLNIFPTRIHVESYNQLCHWASAPVEDCCTLSRFQRHRDCVSVL